MREAGTVNTYINRHKGTKRVFNQGETLNSATCTTLKRKCWDGISTFLQIIMRMQKKRKKKDKQRGEMYWTWPNSRYIHLFEVCFIIKYIIIAWICFMTLLYLHLWCLFLQIFCQSSLSISEWELISASCSHMLFTCVEQMDGKWLVGATYLVCGWWLVIVGILAILTCGGYKDIPSCAIIVFVRYCNATRWASWQKYVWKNDNDRNIMHAGVYFACLCVAEQGQRNILINAIHL